MAERSRLTTPLSAWLARRSIRPAPATPVADVVADRVGDGTGPPVVLLHGQPGAAGDWRWVLPRLPAGLPALVPDRPGYGRTGGAATGFAGNARAVVALLDRLDVERAIVAGHSWSGGVAIRLAEDHPERVAGLVLVSSVGPGERFGWEDRLLAAPLVGELVAGAVLGSARAVVGSRRVRNLADRRLGPRGRDALAEVMDLTSGRSPVWRSFVAEQRAMLEELDGLEAGLAAISAPTRILHGDHDRLVPPAVAASLAAAIPGARLTVVPGAGHLLPHDAPGSIAAAVADVAARAEG